MQLFFVNLCGFPKLSFLEDVASWSDSEGIFRDLKEDLNSPLNLQLHLLVARKDTRGKHFSQPWIIFFLENQPFSANMTGLMPFTRCATRICWLICILWLVSSIINFPASAEQEAHGSFSILLIFLISFQCSRLLWLPLWQKGQDLGNKAICFSTSSGSPMHHPKRQKIRGQSWIF